MQSRTAKDIYEDLAKDRDEFLDRARECAKLTIPFLLADEDHNAMDRFYTPYQGFGARAVNNLSSKLLLALFPTTNPFFRYVADEADMQEAEEQDPDIRTKIESGLKQREKVTMHELENTPFRNPFSLALKLMIVTGNALVYLADDGNIRVFKLDSYVVRRDPSGNVLEIITKEMLDPLMIDEKTREEAGINLREAKDKGVKVKSVGLFTHVKRTPKNWEVYQEINGKVIESTKGTYAKDMNPWLPLRFSRIDGEHYGRGLVEEYFGDFVSLDGFRQNLTEGAAAMSKVVFLVRKNGQTRIKDITKAENGDVKYGSADDVSTLQAEKRADFQVVRETYRDIEAELAKAFLLNSSVSRDAERVTATEIRVVARELEDTLGGVYTVLSQEFQLPFINIFTGRLEKSGKLEKLPSGSVTPTITTGLSALGRTDDLERMLQFMEIIAQLPGAAERLNVGTFIERTATALFIDQEGLMKSDEDIQEEQQQALLAQTAQQAVPGIIQEATKGAIANGQNQETGQ